MVRASYITIRRSARKPRMPVEIIKMWEDETQNRPQARLPVSLSSEPRAVHPVLATRVASPPVRLNASDPLPVEVKALAPPPREDRGKTQRGGGAAQELFEDIVPDLVPAGFSRYQPPAMLAQPSLERTKNC